MSLLSVQGLRKSFGARLLFQVEKLQLECGRSYLVTGSNGVGKTTRKAASRTSMLAEAKTSVR